MRILIFILQFIFSLQVVSQITATDYTDVQIFPSINSQHEVHISINKTNPWNLIISCNTALGQGHYFTIDGGITWNGADNLPNSGVGCCDPSTSFDAEGRGYITTMTPATDGYFVQNTTDNGFTWSTQIRGSGPTGNFDKEMIATVDEMQTSAFANNFYCAWTDFNNGSRVTVNRSTDKTLTFANQTVLSSGFGQGTNVQTGPNGEVYVCWADYTNGSIPAQKIGFASSLDGGVTYSVSTPFTYLGVRTTNSCNSNFGNTRVNDYPSMSVDKSCGVHRGRIYIAYPEFESSGSTKSIIKTRFSDNKGVTWSNSTAINISAGRQNWFPWISVDDLTGLVSVIYFSFDQTSGVATNTYVAYSIDGATWQNTKVSDAPHNTSAIAGFATGYAGDYIGIASFGSFAYCTWMDNRTGTWQIFVSKIIYDIPALISSQTNLEINNPSTIIGHSNYQATQKIRVSNNHSVTLASTSNVEMVAGESIELLPGFYTTPGTTYTAKIENRTPCATPGAIAFKTAPQSWSNLNNILKEEKDGIKVFGYPNPTTDFITIGLLNKNYKSVIVSISDLSGKLLLEHKNPEVTTEQIRQIVNVTSLPTGNYIATIIVNNKKYSIRFNKI